MAESVYVVSYDPRWPSLFSLERSRVEAVLGPWVVEHVGSAAEPDLDVKPVIDLMAGVRDMRDADRCIRPLEEVGYSYWAEDPALDHHRLFVRFANPEWTYRIHNLHVVEVGGEYWENHLLFRDYLRSHSETAEEYALLKRDLAERFRDDCEAYTGTKTDFVSTVEERAKALRA
jgi:GrpB-like predicted nucleotidyltransferase (UPF0157 family)